MTIETVREKWYVEFFSYRLSQWLGITALLLFVAAGLFFWLAPLSRDTATIVADWLVVVASVLLAAAIVCHRVAMITIRDKKIRQIQQHLPHSFR